MKNETAERLRLLSPLRLLQLDAISRSALLPAVLLGNRSAFPRFSSRNQREIGILYFSCNVKTNRRSGGVAHIARRTHGAIDEPDL